MCTIAILCCVSIFDNRGRRMVFEKCFFFVHEERKHASLAEIGENSIKMHFYTNCNKKVVF